MWDLEVKVSRKVDSSAGAGLNGGSIGDVEEALEAVGFAGGLPELFLGLGIVATLLSLFKFAVQGQETSSMAI